MESTEIVVKYYDKDEKFNGWLVIDRNKYALSAGGIRVQKGLTQEKLENMARNMSKKMAVWGLPINGAKCGIDYDPNSPKKDQALYKFMCAIKPFITLNYSMGADLNTNFAELNDIANKMGISSIKQSIQVAQNLSRADFNNYIKKLDNKVHNNISLGQIRAGWGVGSATIELNTHLNSNNTFIIQGFGTLSKGILFRLRNEKINLNAIADAEKCIVDTTGNGIDIDKLLNINSNLLPTDISGIKAFPSNHIYQINADIFIVAATENVINDTNAESILVKGIVQGANLAVTTSANNILHKRGIYVTPSFVSGSAGTLFMNILFGSEISSTSEELLAMSDNIMRNKINQLIELSIKNKTSLETEASILVEQCLNRTITGNPYSLSHI